MNQDHHDETDQILKQVLGIVRADLSDTKPADIVLKVIADSMAHHRQQAKSYASDIARTMHEFAWSVIPMHTHTSGSYSGKFDVAAASMDALREPLRAAVHAYRVAHNLDAPQ